MKFGLLLFTFATLSAQPRTLTVDPAKSEIRWSLGAALHTVHGTFQLTRATMQFDAASGKASGEWTADARSGQSANSSRDSKMHKSILESVRFPEITFHPEAIEGELRVPGVSDIRLRGRFSIHGAAHEITIPARVEAGAETATFTAKFTIPYVAWGLKSPNTFLLKVDDKVEISLMGTGRISGQ